MSLAAVKSPPPGAYWDSNRGAHLLSVMPGEHRVSQRDDVVLVTLLGSCVAACIWDEAARIGGLNHFLLPGGGGEGRSMRYGVNAMEILINDILRQGGQRGRLRAKLFGGASVLDSLTGETVGDRNSRFARDYLRGENIPLLAADLGGDRGRRIFFAAVSGRVRVLALRGGETQNVRSHEQDLRRRAQRAPRSGGVELF